MSTGFGIMMWIKFTGPMDPRDGYGGFDGYDEEDEDIVGNIAGGF
jgi:hypothetical protein